MDHTKPTQQELAKNPVDGAAAESDMAASSRRGLLAGAAVLAAGLTGSPARVLGGPGKAKGTAKKTWDKQPHFKISLAQWSLHRELKAGKLDNLDFPRVASGYGLDAVEWVNQFFDDKAKDHKYLGEMKNRCRSEGIWSALIMIDGEGALGDPDKNARRTAAHNHHQWIDAAAYLGCHSIRVNAKSDGTFDEQIKLAADGLRQVTEHAAPHGINVIVENHGGLSSNGEWLAQTIKTVDHPMCGTLPDFGNFKIKDGEEYDRYKGVAELMPFAKAVSAKTHEFDKRGNETVIDYFKIMKIVLDAGYHGYVGIEYEGQELGEYEGIAATKALLEKVAAKLGPRTA